MPEESFPSGAAPEHLYPHQVPGLDPVTAEHVATDLATNPDAYPPAFDHRLQARGIEVRRPPAETGQDSAPDIATAIGNWEFDENGELQQTFAGGVQRTAQADQRLTRDGLEEDPELAQVMADGVDSWRDQELTLKVQDQTELAHLEAIPENGNDALGVAKARIRARMDSRGDTTSRTALRHAIDPLVGELAAREKLVVEQAISERVEADRFPWTMPNPEISLEIMGFIKDVYEGMVAPSAEPRDDDWFKAPPPMKQFEGSLYAPEDVELLRAGGIDVDNRHLRYMRKELKDAGVFFINRVGGGEQPLFGVPIPDPESEGGVFNVQDRTFLTRKEFDKVYRYQQEHGYGLGNLDPADVQMDMIVFAARPEARKQDYLKFGGFGSRENKYEYGKLRSPFVDLGFQVSHSVEAVIRSTNGSWRMNTTSIHLANAHPDYPGLSEMYDGQAAHDQRYMSAGEFVRNFYLLPPTKQEALVSMQHGTPTARETVWVGTWPTA